MVLTLAELQARLGGIIHGDAGVALSGAASLERAGPADLSFALGRKYLEAARRSRAGALITRADLASAMADEVLDAAAMRPCLVVDNPHASFARALTLLYPPVPQMPGIHPSASVHPGADIASDVHIGPGAVLGDGCRVGPRSRIGAGCVLGEAVLIGADCLLHPRVTLYSGCRVGDRCILHSGCVIGADGFGYAQDGAAWVKVPQIGSVAIGSDVEIGANTTIDRGALDDTLIEDGVKIDNLVQIAHNCHIGAHTAIAGCAGIAGSTRIGRHCMIGGAAMILGHIELGDGVIVSGASFIGKSIATPGVYTSTQPQMPHDEWLRNAAQLRHLADMRQRLRAVEKRLGALQASAAYPSVDH